MKLRPYQIQLKDDIRSAFSEGKKAVILCSPTGSGKTVTFADICSNTIKNGMKVLICVDRKELLEQSQNKLIEYGLKPEIITGGKKYTNYSNNCYVATVQTLKKRKFPFVHLVVIDEAHKQIFDDVAKEYIKRGAFVIGATATPIRKGSKMEQFGNIYSDIIQSVEISDLISDGFLSPARTFGSVVDVESVKLKGGDYDAKQLFDEYNKPFLYDGLIDHWLKIAKGKKTIVFNINVEHSIKTRNSFLQRGITCEHVDGTTPKGERERILRDFKNGRFNVLCNVDILTTGYDEPSIECIIVNRRTKSVPLWLQMCGRGSRIFRNKSEFIILDMGGNTIELGHWERVRQFSLWHKVGVSGGVAPQKQCPEGKIEINENGEFQEVERSQLKGEDQKKYGCGNFVPSSAVVCPDCGFIFPKSKRKMIESDFVEIGSDQKEFPSHLQKPLKEMNFDELLQVCTIKGYKKQWVLHNIEQTDENIRKFAEFMGYKKEWVFNYKKRMLNK